MIEPGKTGDLVRLTISVKAEDEKRLTRLKHKLEAEGNSRLSVSEVFRRALDCLAESKGV